MNEFITIAERDSRYGSGPEFEKFYREVVLRYMEFDQTAVHKNIDDPPPMIYVVVATRGREFSVAPVFLYDIMEKNYGEKLDLVVRYNLDKMKEIFVIHPQAKVIAVVGVCYAYMKIISVSNESELKNIPTSIKDDPQAEEVVLLMSDFCEGEINSAMLMQPDKSCKLMTDPQRVFVTGQDRYHKMLNGLFKRTAQFHYRNN